MGKKSGKKAWKKIDTRDVEDFLEKSTREERQGLAFEGVPDADLFFVDKGLEPEAAAAVAGADVVGKNRKKLTRAQAILQGAHSAKPVVTAPQRKKKGPAQGSAPAAAQPAAAKGKSKRGQLPEAFDLWADEPLALPSGGAAEALTVPPAAGGNTLAVTVVGKPKRQRVGAAPARPAVPAVEIDLPGCSYNPDKEQHQDAIALAVAAEMQKVYRKDLDPVAPPLVVDYEPEADELALLQVVEADDDDDEGVQEEPGEGEAEGGMARRNQKAGDRKTRKDRNREKRRREVEAELEERRRVKAQRRELDRLKQIKGEVEEELQEKEQARLRRQLDRQERMASEPPRLGKQRFEPAPLQVLTTDEASGCLRRLKPTAMLAKDRFKALQKRGIIEPRRKVAKKARKKVVYEQGARWEREREGQQDINEARKRLKKKKNKDNK